ncbi:FMN-dependent NADH-azoreductase [Ferrimicrobium acidiphilum]|uniref:FMN-dependent NADH-azoreductase n=1 Tax=Ferrimicrobium acidiphilum TaxID=121039 RepID=UPI0023EFDE81|nr:NAD(P)H-dependent oxidoreductase [Ferrimicrobium acidiphilum]
MQLFRLDASIRTEGSHSSQIADIVQQEWCDVHPDGRIVTRHLGSDPIPATAWPLAVNATYTPPEQRTNEQVEALALVAKLTDELLDADAVIVAAPLYNFGVSQHLKAWVDMIIADPRMSAEVGPLEGKPAVLVTARGGAYGPGTPREGWDHATPWMRRILADVWKLDLRVVETEFTLVGVNPALDEFQVLAADMRKAAEAEAREHGRAIALSEAAA